jgi:hypothetical protein
MSDPNPEIDQLITELVATRKEIDREIEHLSTHWGIFRPFQISIAKPEAIALIYGIFLAACFVSGIVFSFQVGTISNLGVPLIVGTLFAGGAVAGQIWAFAIQEKHHFFAKAFGDERTKRLENLGKEFWRLQKRIDHLKELPGGAHQEN